MYARFYSGWKCAVYLNVVLLLIDRWKACPWLPPARYVTICLSKFSPVLWRQRTNNAFSRWLFYFVPTIVSTVHPLLPQLLQQLPLNVQLLIHVKRPSINSSIIEHLTSNKCSILYGSTSDNDSAIAIISHPQRWMKENISVSPTDSTFMGGSIFEHHAWNVV